MAVVSHVRAHVSVGADANFVPNQPWTFEGAVRSLEHGSGLRRIEIAAAANTGWQSFIPAATLVAAEWADTIFVRLGGDATLELGTEVSPEVVASSHRFPNATAASPGLYFVSGSETRAAGSTANQYVSFRITNNSAATIVVEIGAIGGNT